MMVSGLVSLVWCSKVREEMVVVQEMQPQWAGRAVE